jgi:hypothetical protein
MSALALPRPLVPPKKWVDQAEPNFARVRSYLLQLRLGSGSFEEFERGPVSFPTAALDDDGEAILECECQPLGPGRFTPREFVSRAYGRGRQFFEEEAQTRSGDRPEQGQLALLLLDAKDKTVARCTATLKRRSSSDFIDVEDSAGMAGELRESSRVNADVTRSLSSAMVSMHGQDRRAESETERLLNDRIRLTTDGMRDVVQGHKDITADAIVAADMRARAEEERKAVEVERQSGKGRLERFLETDTGGEVAKVVAPVLAPAAATVAKALADALGSVFELVSVSAKTRSERARGKLREEQGRLRKLAEERAAESAGGGNAEG